MSIASESVAGFRTRWASRFVDAGTLNRETAIGTYNPATLQHDSPSSSVIWDGTGGCLVRPKARTTADFGEKDSKVEIYDIRVPYTATGAEPGDKFTVSASLLNPDLVGAVLVITEVVDDSYHTHYLWVGQRIKA
jgi:hypothetical protein